jgi:hypothetical protein
MFFSRRDVYQFGFLLKPARFRTFYLIIVYDYQVIVTEPEVCIPAPPPIELVVTVAPGIA